MTEFHYDKVTQHSLWTQGVDATDSPQPSRATVKHLRERLQVSGASVISSADLLAIVLGTGPSPPNVIRQMQTLLASTSLQELLTIDFGELSKTHLLGDAKAAQLQAVFELARRLTLPADTERYQILSPADAATLVRADMSYLDHEEMRVLCLDTKNHVVANIRLYQGTINSSVVRAAEIFRPAVTRNCPGILICHNHPSGDPTPSDEDLEATKHIVDAGKILDVDVVDHLIIGKNHSFVSLREKMTW